MDNPEGDDQADLLILGVHDRNRALQSDVVVVRIKSRENWVVSLFILRLILFTLQCLWKYSRCATVSTTHGGKES